MYTMREVCKETGMTYEGLKFYCNQGLVPNVKRDKNNRRVFDEHAMRWVNSLSCLKNCEMSIAEMQQYLAYCLEGAVFDSRAEEDAGKKAGRTAGKNQTAAGGGGLHRLEAAAVR